MIIVLLGLVIRFSVSLNSYSGENIPPMYGDYEAQRHWMEITYNLPVKEWYFNTTNNDLMYWGLDYPPLTAYHSLLSGITAAFFNHSYVELLASRGFESQDHKIFMRLTVVVADLLTFIPAILLYFSTMKNSNMIKGKESNISTNEASKLSCLLALIYPGIILIDHGHFQYNCVSLGLLVFSVVAVVKERHFIASVLFCLALLYKQMELYHSLPFFFYLLGCCVNTYKISGFKTAIYQIMCLGIAVTSTIFFVCFPFLTNFEQAQQLFIRLFPIARGVFEDKVANVWCVVNIVYKLKSISNANMAKICLISTLLAVIPSSYDVFRNTSLSKFKYSLINSALAFYLFSYQVHEKTILLVAIPALLVMPNDSLACVWLLSISNFSMVPLLKKDNLLLPTTILNILFIGIFLSSSFVKCTKVIETTKKNYGGVLKSLSLRMYHLYLLSMLGCTMLTIGIAFANPPKRYPDLFPLLVSVYSCVHFVGFFIYFNVKQFITKEDKEKSA